MKSSSSEISDVITTAWVFSILFSSVSRVESKHLNFEFRLPGGDGICYPWWGGANFVVDGIFWRRAIISRNSTILKCSIFHFKAFPLMKLQNLFQTWDNLQKWFKLLHTAIPLNRKVFHSVTVKKYNLGLLEYIKTEWKFLIKSIACHIDRAWGEGG